ncbi:MAG: hypothetical protein KC486_11660 [Myxococcales bacterium]|nr:hypothetical protein [Myxococcales bacterium]
MDTETAGAPGSATAWESTGAEASSGATTTGSTTTGSTTTGSTTTGSTTTGSMTTDSTTTDSTTAVTATTTEGTTGTTDGGTTTTGEWTTGTTDGGTTTTGEGTTGTTDGGTTTTDGSGGSDSGTTTTDGEGEGVECVAEPEDDPDATWSRRFPTDSELTSIYWPDLAVDLSGAIVWGAHFSGPIDLGGGLIDEYWRVFLAKHSDPCTLDWSRVLGGDESPIHNFALTTAANGDVIVVGAFSGAIDFGGATLEATFGIDGVGDVIWYTDDLFIARYSPDGALLWARRFGDDATQRAYDVAVTDEGELIVVGSLRGTVDFGNAVAVADESYDGLVARFTADGEHVWHSTFSAPADVDIFNVDVSAGGLVSIGGLAASGVDFGGGPLLAKDGNWAYVAQFEPTGAHRWSRRVTSGYRVRSLVADDVGALYVAGVTKPDDDVPTDAFLMRFDPDGGYAWIRESAADTSADGRDLALSAAGEAEVVGPFRGTIDFGGGPLTAVDGSTDAFFVRFDPAGEVVLQTQLDTPKGASVLPLAHRFGPAGERVTVGNFRGTVDFGAGPMTSGEQGTRRETFLRRAAP